MAQYFHYIYPFPFFSSCISSLHMSFFFNSPTIPFFPLPSHLMSRRDSEGNLDIGREKNIKFKYF